MAHDMPFGKNAPLEEEEEEEVDAEAEVPALTEEGGDELVEDYALGEEELAGEEGMEYGSLEESVEGLIADWQPTTPEGEQYKADLEAALSGSQGGALEEEGLGLDEGPPDLAGLRNQVVEKLGPMLGGSK